MNLLKARDVKCKNPDKVFNPVRVGWKALIF
jgi:hypothetical protein